MTETIKIDDELKARLDDLREPDESHAELIEELVSIYETDAASLQEGYSE